MEQAPLVAELLQEALALLLVEGVRELEALDRDGLPEAGVHAAVDDAEAAVPDHGGDAVLALDGRAAELEGILKGFVELRHGCGHAPARS